MDMLSNRSIEQLDQRILDADSQLPAAARAARLLLIKKIALPLGILLAGIGTVVLINLLQQPPEKKPITALPPGVQTERVQLQATTLTVASQGIVAPRTETTLITEVAGAVINVSPKLQVGGFFRAGETLLALDARDYEATVKQAEASLLGKKAQLAQEVAQTEQAEREWKLSGRAKENAPLLALRKPFLEKAQAEVLYAEAELDQAQRKLERTQIRAPYDGLIKSKRIGQGQYVTTGTTLAEIIAVDVAEVRLPISEQELAFLALPTPRESVDSANAPQREYPTVILTSTIGGIDYQWAAKIVRSEGMVDAKSRVHYAVAQVVDPYGLHGVAPTDQSVPQQKSQQKSQSTPQPKPALAMGSFVKAQVQGITLPNLAAIPRSAFRDHNTVMTLDAEGRLRLKQVEVARTDAEFIYVQAGIENGEAIITTAIAAPVEGMALRALNSDDG